MDEQAAIVFGSLIGAVLASAGVIVVLALKLWPGVKRLLRVTAQVGSDLDEALGKRELSQSQTEDAPDSGAHRRQTGAFQTIVRQELDEHLAPVTTQLARLQVGLADLTVSHDATQKRLDRQIELVADLARGHNTVVRRVNEHSAELNVAEAEKSMTAGSFTA